MAESSDSKRIAKNTLMLYFRQILIMMVSLYTSRVVLQNLGIIDYGIYNTVAGFVAMFSIISGSIAVAISRFLTIEVGRGNDDKLNVVFSTSFIIQIFILLFVIALAEILGVWFLNAKMVIPEERLLSSNIVFQCSLITFAINLLSVPYNALIIAYEKMSAFAYISILEVLLKLFVTFLIKIFSFDKLSLYAFLLCIVSVAIRLVYGIYCKVKFKKVRFKFFFDRTIFKEMFSFIGWAFLGNGVIVLRDQGVNVLLNLYCGPAINAARGVAMQVNTAVYSFVQNFMTAVNPQITKNYANKQYNEMHKLIIQSSKLGFFIMLILVVPLCANINYILSIWLVEVPEFTSNFIKLVLIFSLTECLSQPLVTGVLAEGHIKTYEIFLTLIYIVYFIICLFLLKLKFSPDFVFLSLIIAKVFVIILLLFRSKKYGFEVIAYLKGVILYVLPITAVSFGFITFLPVNNAQNFGTFMIQSMINFLFTSIVIFLIGITKEERKMLKQFIANKLRRTK